MIVGGRAYAYCNANGSAVTGSFARKTVRQSQGGDDSPCTDHYTISKAIVPGELSLTMTGGSSSA